MSLRSALGWGTLQSIVRLAIGFVSIKVTAVYLGAAGLALVGQINNFLAFAQGGIGSALQTGITKLTAEAAGDRQQQLAIWRAGLLLSLAITLPLGCAVALLSGQASEWLFHTAEYRSVVLLAGPCLILVVLTYVLNAVMNGMRMAGRLSMAQMAAMVTSAAIFVPSAYLWGLDGALFGSVLAVASGALVTLPFILKARLASWHELYGQPDRRVVKDLLSFFPMLMVNSAIPPLALIWVRDLLASHMGLDAAGYWQASWRLSEMYLMVLTTGLSLHLMPHLSLPRDDHHFGRELKRSVAQVAGLAAVSALPLILLRDFVVALVFTSEFSVVRDLIVWQLAGDALRLAAWPLRMTLVIRRHAKQYIALELLQPALHLAGTWLLLPSLGLNAAVVAYVIAVLITNALLLISLRCVLFGASMREQP